MSVVRHYEDINRMNRLIDAINNNQEWISINERLPREAGAYLIYAPSVDKDKPMKQTAWYEPGLGWSLLPKIWIKAITHWRELPEDPCVDGTEIIKDVLLNNAYRLFKMMIDDAPLCVSEHFDEAQQWLYAFDQHVNNEIKPRKLQKK